MSIGRVTNSVSRRQLGLCVTTLREDEHLGHTAGNAQKLSLFAKLSHIFGSVKGFLLVDTIEDLS